jgi:hypothetical protein
MLVEQAIAQVLTTAAGNAELAEVFGPSGTQSFLHAGPTISPEVDQLNTVNFTGPVRHGDLLQKGVPNVFALWDDISKEREALLQAA